MIRAAIHAAARHAALIVATIAATMMMAPGPAAAQARLSAPATVAIPAGGAGTFTVSGPKAGTVGATLDADAGPGIDARIIGSSTTASTRYWLVRLTLDPELVADGRVTLSLRGLGVAGMPAATVAVTVAPSGQPASAVTAEILGDGETVLDGQPATISLKLANASNMPLRVTSIRLFPQTVLLTAPARQLDRWPVLAPHSVLIETITVRADRSHPPAPGKHLIGLAITLTRASGAPLPADLVVTKEIATGVPGMTELQNVLQVPSFLLLPGFLVIVAFVIVWRWAKPIAGSTAASFAIATSPVLWVVAITISGLIVLIYPWATAFMMGAPRAILYGYDLGDVGRVWIGSIVFGGAAALIALLADLASATWHARRSFVAGEAPLPFLARLKRMGRTHRFSYAEARNAAQAVRPLFALDLRDDGATVWAAPSIQIEVPPGRAGKADPPALARLADGAAIAPLIAALQAAADAGDITLRWDPLDGVDGPTRVDRARVAGATSAKTKSLVDAG